MAPPDRDTVKLSGSAQKGEEMERSESVLAAHRGRLLEVRGLRCGYDKREIVHGIDFDVREGEFVCVLGPNGCGKSTTLKTVLGLLMPFAGTIEVRGASTVHMSEAERARHFAYIPQTHTPPFPFSVADVVILGRTPFINKLANVSDEDMLVAYDCMERMGITDLAERPYTQLSGGQQQSCRLS